MKKILIVSLISMSILGITVGMALAVDQGIAPGNSSIPGVAPGNSYSIDLNDINPLGSITLQGLIDRVANWALAFLIAISVLFIIYAAYLFMFAEGIPANVQKAKNIILYTVVAIIIGLMARVIILAVREILGAK